MESDSATNSQNQMFCSNTISNPRKDMDKLWTWTWNSWWKHISVFGCVHGVNPVINLLIWGWYLLPIPINIVDGLWGFPHDSSWFQWSISHPWIIPCWCLTPWIHWSIDHPLIHWSTTAVGSTTIHPMFDSQLSTRRFEIRTCSGPSDCVRLDKNP